MGNVQKNKKKTFVNVF